MFRNNWTRGLIFAISLATTVPSLLGQWVPLSGRVETTVESVSPNGTINSKWTTTSLYARAGNGSIVTQRIGRSGRAALGTVVDTGRTGKVYSINYRDGKVVDTHHALEHTQASHPATTLDELQTKTALGRETYAGEDCAIMPIYDAGPNQSTILVGKAWVAPRLNGLILKEDIVRKYAGGGSQHVVKRMFILKQGVEPKSELFALDSPSVLAYGKKQAEIH